jgi:two-component system sensor histidine kinase/response regulator
MDVRMPVMDGPEAPAAIRADAGLPILAMSADAFEEDAERARGAGMTGCVVKPADPVRLLSALRECLGG